MSLAQLWNPSVVIERYQVFLIYIAMLVLSVLYNIFLAVRVPWVGTVFSAFLLQKPQQCLLTGLSVFVSTIVFLAIVIACVASAPSFQPHACVLRFDYYQTITDII